MMMMNIYTPKTAPSPSTITTPIYNTHPSTNPTHHSKRHKDSISRFATVHFPDRQTDRPTDTHTHRPTDGISDRSIPIVLTLYSIAAQRRAKNTQQ